MKSLYTLIFCISISIGYSQTLVLTEVTSGNYRVDISFDQNAANTEVLLRNTFLKFFIPSGQNITIINNMYNFMEGESFQKSVLDGACSGDFPGDWLSIDENALIDLGNITAGGVFELFNFTGPTGVVAYDNSNSCLNGGLGVSTTNIDYDGDGIGNDASAYDFPVQNLLPVEFISFTAEKRNEDVILNWLTESEINNDFFEVQRSADGIAFETIGKVNGAGTTNETQNYAFLDRDPIYGKNYYRLQQFDYNGDSEYSEVRIVDFSRSSEITLSVFPNPVSNTLFIQSGEDYKDVFIVGQNGQRLRQILDPVNQNNSVSVDVSDLPSGMYFVEMKNDAEIVTKKFVKI